MGKTGYHHITKDERTQLDALRRAGISVSQCARQLGFCRQTIYNELRRGEYDAVRKINGYLRDVKEYSAEKGQQLHERNQQATDRPQSINDRKEPGHKEIDLIVGCKGSKAAVLTIVDRKGRGGMGFKLPDKKAASVQAVFDRLERKLGKKRFRETFRSITTDNGSEFLEYERLTKSIFGGKRFEVYYCHPYSAWEKGTNENTNRMLRRFFPKGTNFGKVSQREIQEAIDWINHYPRKILGWKCAADLMKL